MSIRNLVTGVVSSSSVNVDMAKAVGIKILNNMTSQVVSEYVFKASSKAINMSKKLMLKDKKGETVSVDPMLLFQRLIAISTHDKTVNLEEVFKYELSPYPSSLFDSDCLMREANKPKLANALSKLGSCDVEVNDMNSTKYVIDGGDLLQKIIWQKHKTFEEICDQYLAFLSNHYQHVVVVFDSYPNHPTTKDETHKRRAMKKVAKKKADCTSPDIIFDSKTILTIDKDKFLANRLNKQNFLNMLSEYLQQHTIEVRIAEDDADVLIVEVAVQFSSEGWVVVVVSQDTDILVLSLYGRFMWTIDV
jgi:hypothetical protein